MSIKLVDRNTSSRAFLVACDTTVIGTRRESDNREKDVTLPPTKRQYSKWLQGRGLAWKKHSEENRND